MLCLFNWSFTNAFELNIKFYSTYFEIVVAHKPNLIEIDTNISINQIKTATTKIKNYKIIGKSEHF